MFDAAFLYEAEDRRGRAPGELMDLQTRFLTTAGLDAGAIERASGELDAIRRATAIARPGDLVCYMTGRVQGGIEWLHDCEERARASAAAGA